jgi:hypothetical protein
MSICANTVQSNQQSYFFALSGGAAGTLQSPAAVIPQLNGNATLSIPAGAGGAAGLSVIADVGDTASIFLTGDGHSFGFQTNVGGLAIGSVGSPNSAIEYNPTAHTMILGDGGPNGVISTANPLRVGNEQLTATNGVFISPSSDTASFITNGIATGGTLNIGSSAATPSTISVNDAGPGSANVIIGGNSGNGLQIIGGQTNVTNAIRPAIATGGALSIGSSYTTNPSAIVINDTNTTIANQSPPVGASTTCIINGSTTVIPVGTYRIDPPAGVTFTTGIWWFALNALGAANSQFQVNTLVYFDSAVNAGNGGFTTGGAAVSNTDGNGKTVVLYPTTILPYMTISFNGTSGFPGYVTATPLFLSPVVGLG